MGCDIHMVVERKFGERWVGVHACPYGWAEVMPPTGGFVSGRTYWPVRSRNYDLFAALAGVRGDGPEPRGLPDDASDLTVMEAEGWGDDGHSHSWLPLSEALMLFIQHRQVGALEGGHPLDYFGVDVYTDEDNEGDPPDLNARPTLAEYRLVFWFDN